MSDGNRDNLGSILGFAAKLIVGGALAAGTGYAAYKAAEQLNSPQNHGATRSGFTSQPWRTPSNSDSWNNSQRETSRPSARRQRGPTDCGLCDETLIGRSMSRAIPCEHIFHEECIAGRTYCPDCSRPIARLQ